MDNFVRRWNMDGYERYWIPLPSLSAPDRRGLINETAFRLFGMLITAGKQSVADDPSALDNAFIAAGEYVYGSSQAALSPLDKVERREVVTLAGRLSGFFSHSLTGVPVRIFPEFEGAGIINKCNGDVASETEIFEIKGGDRNFRSVDYRQVAIYATLHYATCGKVFDQISLVNPRRGIVVRVPTETFTSEVAGKSPVPFFHSLIDIFSGSLVSG